MLEFLAIPEMNLSACFSAGAAPLLALTTSRPDVDHMDALVAQRCRRIANHGCRGSCGTQDTRDGFSSLTR